MLKSSLWKSWALRLLCLGVASIASAQSFHTIATFNGSNNGGAPLNVTPIQGADGNIYGTACCYNDGSVFRLDHSSSLTSIFTFNGSDGSTPYSGLLLAEDGNFYGTTGGGGSNGWGTIFRLAPSGSFDFLYAFCSTNGCPDGARPTAPLIKATDGSFYGTTIEGGLRVCPDTDSCGTIFKMTSTAELTVLYSFCQLSNCADGFSPSGGLVQGADGSLYGTTGSGGLGFGTVYKITTAGQLTTLYTFCADTNCPDGSNPANGLLQGSDGNFYGSTEYGGSSPNCGNGCGTVFKITPSGVLTTLHSFSSTDGWQPLGPLTQGTDGNFYGTTRFGGSGYQCSGGCGTVFQLTPQGTLTVVHNFHGQPDGNSPEGGILQSTDGKFYGTTTNGGASDLGTIFRFDMGLSSFVSLVRQAGKAGQKVGILGQSLQGTTAVLFDGVSAPFTVQSQTFLSTIVPAGATTGFVTVTTSNGTFTSNVAFQVVP